MAQNQRGFAAMEPEQQKSIASKGGRAAHQSGHAHEWNSTEAAEAGRKGGLASHHDRASFHRDSAAHHQSVAAKHRSEGAHETAELHEGTATSHIKRAEEYEEQSANADQDQADNDMGEGTEPYAKKTDADAGWGQASHENRG